MIDRSAYFHFAVIAAVVLLASIGVAFLGSTGDFADGHSRSKGQWLSRK